MIKLYSLHCIYQYCVPGACSYREIKFLIPSSTSVHVFQISLYIQHFSSSVESEATSGRVAKVVRIALGYTALTGEVRDASLGCLGPGQWAASSCGRGRQGRTRGCFARLRRRSVGWGQYADHEMCPKELMSPLFQARPLLGLSWAALGEEESSAEPEHCRSSFLSTETVGAACVPPLLAYVCCIGGTADGEAAFHAVLALSVLVLHGKHPVFVQMVWIYLQ